MISICRFRKSGQFKVRTQESKNHTPLRSRRDQRKQNVGHLFAFRSCRIGTLEPTIADSKSGQFKVRTPLSKTSILAAF